MATLATSALRAQNATPGDKQHPVQPTSSTSHDSRAALGAYTASRATRALPAALAMLQAPACPMDGSPPRLIMLAATPDRRTATMTVASLPAGRLLLVPWRGSGHMGCPQPLSTVPAVAVHSHCAHWSAVSSLQASASGAVTWTAAGAEPASPRGADGAARSGASRSAGECSRCMRVDSVNPRQAATVTASRSRL